MTRVAAVFCVGRTTGACEFALDEILAREAGSVHVYLFYGEPAEGQVDSPVAAVARLHARPLGARVVFEVSRSTQAYSLDRAYSTALDFVREIQGRSYDRVYLGITGGTNPMIAALFHAGMIELHGDVIPIYVQSKPLTQSGGEQQSIEFISSPRTRDTLLLERALGLARDSRLPLAAALAAWDDFRYTAADDLKSLSERVQDFADDPHLMRLNGTIHRYASFARHCLEMESCFSDPDRFDADSRKAGWKARVENCAVWLPVDALANAGRRLSEGRYADALVRAYRAVEISIQNRLFALGVHPSHLNWEKVPLSSVREKFVGPGDPPREVAFERGLELLGVLTGEEFAKTKTDRVKLQSARNLCYLEHGYSRIDRRSCDASLARARILCEEILGPAAEVPGRLSQSEMEL